jgi:hypothetical protein
MNDQTTVVRASQPASKRAGPLVAKSGAFDGGRPSAAPVVRVLGGGLPGGSGWSILERRRLSDIRVELRFSGSAPGLRRLSRPLAVRSSSRESESHSLLWVILGRARGLFKSLRADSSQAQEV